ncbi:MULTISPECIES: PepSY-like domain-containing protein [unclassified Saccharicrinis]|uniref:PepSY-like domain-containing protein n=1 Tax=unclassified Saccharicrinis TaxID=2646859 RepID=UPI003D344404
MKRKSLVFISMLFLTVTFVYAQNVMVPKAVKAAFGEKFPGAENPVWKKANDNYQVHFLYDTEHHALFAIDGKWLKTVAIISEDDLPEAASEYISETYEEFEIKQAQQIVTNKGKTSYQVILLVDEDKVKLDFDALGDYVEK